MPNEDRNRRRRLIECVQGSKHIPDQHKPTNYQLGFIQKLLLAQKLSYHLVGSQKLQLRDIIEDGKLKVPIYGRQINAIETRTQDLTEALLKSVSEEGSSAGSIVLASPGSGKTVLSRALEVALSRCSKLLL